MFHIPPYLVDLINDTEGNRREFLESQHIESCRDGPFTSTLLPPRELRQLLRGTEFDFDFDPVLGKVILRKYKTYG